MVEWLFPDYRILLFAKAPLAGAVKTRLQPVLGVDGALALYRQLLAHAATSCAVAGVAPLTVLASAPSAELEQLATACKADLEYQCEGDLGARMHTAAEAALQRAAAVLLVGADCPWLERDYLYAAAQQLAQGADAVLGPALDGGYVLLGLRRVDPALFRDIEWSTAEVAASTRQRLRQLGWRWAELPVLADIDRPEDLAALRRHPSFKQW